MSADATYRGTVKWFNTLKGFGFIGYPEGDGTDIFVHYSAIVDSGYKKLEEGDEVEFMIVMGEKNRPQAANVVKVKPKPRS